MVDRSNKPPVWDQTIYGPIYVKENTAVGETVTTVKARSVRSAADRTSRTVEVKNERESALTWAS